MKKTGLFIALLGLFSLASCGSKANTLVEQTDDKLNNETITEETTTTQEIDEEKKKYFELVNYDVEVIEYMNYGNHNELTVNKMGAIYYRQKHFSFNPKSFFEYEKDCYRYSCCMYQYEYGNIFLEYGDDYSLELYEDSAHGLMENLLEKYYLKEIKFRDGTIYYLNEDKG